MQIRTAVKLKNIVSVRVIISKNCLIDTGTELDFNKAGIYYVGIVCAGKFQLQIDMSASSLKRNLRSDGRNKSSLTLCANRNL